MPKTYLKRYEKEDKKPRKRGRKPVMTEEVKDNILKVISSGCTEKDAFEYAGVSRETFYKYVRENIDFSDAVKKAHARSRVAVCNKLVELVNKGNLGAIIWWQKNRAGWRDVVEDVSDSRIQITFTTPRPAHVIQGQGEVVEEKLKLPARGDDS